MSTKVNHLSTLDSIFEPRPLYTFAIAEELEDYISISVPELGTEEPYYETYYEWVNSTDTITEGDLALLYRYQADSEEACWKPFNGSYSEWSGDPKWHTVYPHDSADSQLFEIPECWGGNKR